MAVKKNQKELYRDIKLYLNEQIDNGFKNAGHDYYETNERGHGREERRRYWTTGNIGWLNSIDKWEGIKSIGVVESTRILNGKKSQEKRYYITSIKSNAKEFGRAVRNHWKVENSCHWILNVCFREDDCRKRVRRSAQNFAIIRRIVLNILKSDKTVKMGIKGKRLKAGWDLDYLKYLLAQF